MGGEWGGTQLSGHQFPGIGLAVDNVLICRKIKKTQLVVAQLNIAGVRRSLVLSPSS